MPLLGVATRGYAFAVRRLELLHSERLGVAIATPRHAAPLLRHATRGYAFTMQCIALHCLCFALLGVTRPLQSRLCYAQRYIALAALCLAVPCLGCAPPCCAMPLLRRAKRSNATLLLRYASPSHTLPLLRDALLRLAQQDHAAAEPRSALRCDAFAMLCLAGQDLAFAMPLLCHAQQHRTSPLLCHTKRSNAIAA